MAELNPYVFRAYDVRGKVGIDITPPVFELVGRAYGTLVKRRGGHAVALGMDNRTSSRALKEAFATGLLSTGLDVVDIGVNHTPLLYFATAHWKLDGGATITGSHNPADHNGFKICLGKESLHGDHIQEMRRRIEAGRFRTGHGGIESRPVVVPYQEYVEKNGFSIVRDMVGHGIGREYHEEPQVPNFGPPGQGIVLEAGLVLAIEPMVNTGAAEVFTLEDGWTIVTADRSLSAHFEDTVAVTADGPEILTR